MLCSRCTGKRSNLATAKPSTTGPYHLSLRGLYDQPLDHTLSAQPLLGAVSYQQQGGKGNREKAHSVEEHAYGGIPRLMRWRLPPREAPIFRR